MDTVSTSQPQGKPTHMASLMAEFTLAAIHCKKKAVWSARTHTRTHACMHRRTVARAMRAGRCYLQTNNSSLTIIQMSHVLYEMDILKAILPSPLS